jgi:hypothetical protein
MTGENYIMQSFIICTSTKILIKAIKSRAMRLGEHVLRTGNLKRKNCRQNHLTEGTTYKT